MALRAGVSRVNITPPVGCMMGGYAARNHGAEGIHDELQARVLYLANEEQEVALVMLEVLGLPCESVQSVRHRVEELTGLPAANILISATHTHSGPDCRGTDDINARYVASLEDKLVGAITWARNQAKVGAHIRFMQMPVQCGINRRERRGDRIVLGQSPDGPIYPHIDLLLVTEANNRPLAAWFCHPCHAVVMGQGNYLISGDFAGAACRFVEANSSAVALFANGFAGNINSIYHNAGFPEVERLGRRLGAVVIQALAMHDEPGIDAVHLGSYEHHFYLPTDPVPTVVDADHAVAVAEAALAAGADLQAARRALHAAHKRLELAQAGAQQPLLPITAHVLTIGDTAILGVANEVFTEFTREIQAQSPFARTILCGYTNGYVGYIPTRVAFAEGGYEVEMGRASYFGLRITPDAGDALVAGCLEALQKAWRNAETDVA